MYTAFVSKITTKEFPGKDKIQLGNCLGYQVILGKEINDGDLGIFFESDGQLSEEFCEKNNLIGVKNPDGTRTGGLFKDNRRVKAIKISGQRSEGFWIPLSSIAYTGVKLDSLKEGDQFVELNGHAICNKYVTPATQRALDNATKTKSRGNKFHITLSKKSWEYHFPKHIDTGHFKKELGRIPAGATIYISEKMHGTSHRISNLPVKETSGLVNFLTNAIWKVNSTLALKFKKKFTKEQFRVLHGTRNTVLNEEFFTKNGYYGGDAFRRNACRYIVPNKNEVIYGEIVGYTTTGRGIMQDHDLTKLSNKALTKKFGNKISYSYGKEVGFCSFYIYRITRINETGNQEELPWPEVVERAQELNTPTVLNLIKSFEYDGDKEKLSALVEEIVNGKSGSDAFPSTFTDEHIMEGVVVRFEKDGQVGWLKEKSFVFKVLEGICKESEDYVDMEESS